MRAKSLAKRLRLLLSQEWIESQGGWQVSTLASRLLIERGQEVLREVPLRRLFWIFATVFLSLSIFCSCSVFSKARLSLGKLSGAFSKQSRPVPSSELGLGEGKWLQGSIWNRFSVFCSQSGFIWAQAMFWSAFWLLGIFRAARAKMALTF